MNACTLRQPANKKQKLQSTSKSPTGTVNISVWAGLATTLPSVLVDIIRSYMTINDCRYLIGEWETLPAAYYLKNQDGQFLMFKGIIDINQTIFSNCPGYVINIAVEDIDFRCWQPKAVNNTMIWQPKALNNTMINVILASRSADRRRISLQLPYMTVRTVTMNPNLILAAKDNMQTHPVRKHMPLRYTLNVRTSAINKRAENNRPLISPAPYRVYEFFASIEEALIRYACNEPSILAAEKKDAIQLSQFNTQAEAIAHCVRSRFHGVFYPPREDRETRYSDLDEPRILLLQAPMLDVRGSMARYKAINTYASLGKYFPDTNYLQKFNVVPTFAPDKTTKTIPQNSEIILRGDLVAPCVYLTVKTINRGITGRKIQLIAQIQYTYHIPCEAVTK
jgi:hypothetical protein